MRKRRILAVAAAATLALSMVGCGSGGSSSGGSSSSGVANKDKPLCWFNRQPSNSSTGELDKDALSYNKDTYYVGFDANQGAELQGQMVLDYIKANAATIDRNGDGVIGYVLAIGDIGHNDSIARTRGVRSALGTGVDANGAVDSTPAGTNVDGKATVVQDAKLDVDGKTYTIRELASQEMIELVMNWYSAIFASVVVAFPLMYRTARGAFESFDETLAWSAQTLGLSNTWIFWRVRMPYCRQGILAGTVQKQIEQLKQVKKSLQSMNEEKWNRKYKLAKIYYEHYGNLEVSVNFKTINGYDYDENGIALGRWIDVQRQAYKGNTANKITEEQIELLRQIGMRFETKNKEEEWNKKYELVKVYFEHYRNLEMPQSFKTVNGYDYDESGIALGLWIYTQRQAYKENKISEERIKLLRQIGMRFETKNKEEEWNKKYELAKVYFEHYGNLEAPVRFKTKNGYEYDENGIRLGVWICTQKQAYKGQGKNKITEEQIELLKQIGMRFDVEIKERKNGKENKVLKKVVGVFVLTLAIRYVI